MKRNTHKPFPKRTVSADHSGLTEINWPTYGDRYNNVESFFYSTFSQHPSYTHSIDVKVKAIEMCGDALAQDPGEDPLQDFALILYNFVPDP